MLVIDRIEYEETNNGERNCVFGSNNNNNSSISQMNTNGLCSLVISSSFTSSRRLLQDSIQGGTIREGEKQRSMRLMIRYRLE